MPTCKKHRFFLLLSIAITTVTYASNSHLKLAILDNFRYQKYVTTRYKAYYTAGLSLAINRWKRKGVNIEYKIFQYDQSPLSIFGQVPKLLKWNPDVIIGPRDSNKFLLLSHTIKNILTVSPFATSSMIKEMPDNFFSLTLPAKYTSSSIYFFIKHKLPAHNIFILTESECKSCVDVTKSLIKIVHNNYKHVKLKSSFYISEQLPFINIKKFLEGYKKGDVIILPDNAHNSAVLMARMSEHLSNQTIFIGGDGWGAWKDTEVGKLGITSKYQSYHITPWGIHDYDIHIHNFKELYKKQYGKLPNNKLSYVVFRTVESIMQAYTKYRINSKENIKNQILKSYQKAILSNPYWFQPTKYLIYKIYDKKNILYASIDVLNGNIVYLNQ